MYYVDHNTRTTSWLHPTSGQEDIGPMPPGWEMKQIKDGRLFFVDHSKIYCTSLSGHIYQDTSKFSTHLYQDT